MKEITIAQEAALAEFARKLSPSIAAGTIIGLIGELGVGKTTFVREFVAGLNPNLAHEVHSPTFGLVHEYATQPPVVHIDLYRLEDRQDQAITEVLEQIGFLDYLDGQNIILIEWFDQLPPEYCQSQFVIEFRFGSGGPESRILRIPYNPTGGHSIIAI